MESRYAADFLVGTGAAQNVEIGFVPDWVRVINVTDGDALYEGCLAPVRKFTSGGTREVKRGDQLVQLTNGRVSASGVVRKVLRTSGSWAGGDAAGYLIFETGSLVGTLGDAAAAVAPQKGARSSADHLTLAANDAEGIKVAAAVASAAANQNIVPYVGTSGAGSEGFTIESEISESGKLLHFQAWSSGSRVDA